MTTTPTTDSSIPSLESESGYGDTVTLPAGELEWWRGAIAAMCMTLAGAIFIIGWMVVRWPDTTPADPALVIPTCGELDDMGYDGLASCIDADGRVVRPGS